MKEDINKLLELLHSYLLEDVLRSGESQQDTEIFQGIKDSTTWLDSVQETAALDPYTCELIPGDRVSVIGQPKPTLEKFIINIDNRKANAYEVAVKYNIVVSRNYSRKMIKLESRGGVKIGE